MITEEEFMEKVYELLETTKADALVSARKVYRSSLIEYGDYENDYILPKMFMSAYGVRLKRMWYPLSSDKEMDRSLRSIQKLISHMGC